MEYSFDEARHIHKLDGKNLHGVTSILRNWGDPGSLINWAAGVAVDAMLAGESPADAKKAYAKKRDAAGDKGTQMHAELEEMMNDYKRGVVREYSPIVSSVLYWLKTENIKPLEAEMHVYSKEHWFGGIMDGLVEKDGKKYILDFKTSGSIQTKAFYQCGAYSVALKEMQGEGAAGAVIVHIPKGESFSDSGVYWRFDMEPLEEAFKSILQVYKLDLDVKKLIK